MKDEVRAFVWKWVEDAVVPTDAGLRAEHTEALAADCYKDAAKAGFSEEEIDNAVGELNLSNCLASYIRLALDKAGYDEFFDRSPGVYPRQSPFARYMPRR
jgi:hypothetical protein